MDKKRLFQDKACAARGFNVFLKASLTSAILLFAAVVNYGCGQTPQKSGVTGTAVAAAPVSYSDMCEQNKDQAYAYLMKKAKFIGVTASLYELKPRENLWTVAKKYGVDINTIVGANFELKNLKSRVGQKIIIMSERGVLHEVKAGTPRDLKTIEMLYGVLPEDITKYNKIGWWINEGDILFIHNAKPVDLKPELAVLYERKKIFRSPLTGCLTSFFGKRHDPIIQGFTEFHNGVDIGVKVGSWVAAAADGVVIYAGWENGFGNTVKIKHANGYTTLYGHLSKIFVKVGQKVKKGKLIAKSGNTGRSTGPHLHFSIFKDGVAQNPLDYIW